MFLVEKTCNLMLCDHAVFPVHLHFKITFATSQVYEDDIHKSTSNLKLGRTQSSLI